MQNLFLIVILSLSSCLSNKETTTTGPDNTKSVEIQARAAKSTTSQKPTEGLSKAYFASGCFWCVEAVFESVEGVGEVVSGYAGGSAEDANYSDVSAGITDHAEAVEVYYDSDKISYNTLLEVFFGSHDPRTLNRQGPDKGRQYRSAIFYQNDSELIAAKDYIGKLKADGVYSQITTTLEPLDIFYAAEAYHQDYEARNPNQPYVRSVSVPRLKRFQKKYPHLLKDGAADGH